MTEDIHEQDSLKEIAQLLVQQSESNKVEWSINRYDPLKCTVTYPDLSVTIERRPMSRQYELAVVNEIGLQVAVLAADIDDFEGDLHTFHLLERLHDLAQSAALNRGDLLNKLRSRLIDH